MRVRVVAYQVEILVCKVENAVDIRVQLHAGQRTGFARQLEFHLLQMVGVDMGVAQRVDEIARLQPRDLRHHLQQQGVRGDVERDAQEDVGAPLVELQAQPARRHVELEEGVAGRQVHVLQVGHVPGADDDAPRIGIVADGLDRLANLVDKAAVVVGPRAPLVAVDMPQVAVGIGPLVPDADAVLLEILHIGIPAQEPEQFVDNRLEVELLGRQQREAVVQTEAHLVPEDAGRARSRPVFLMDTFRQNTVQ